MVYCSKEVSLLLLLLSQYSMCQEEPKEEDISGDLGLLTPYFNFHELKMLKIRREALQDPNMAWIYDQDGVGLNNRTIGPVTAREMAEMAPSSILGRVQFLLYTRFNRDRAINFVLDGNLGSAGFLHNNRRTIVLAKGWQGAVDPNLTQEEVPFPVFEVEPIFLAHLDVNLIVVDWLQLSSHSDYFEAAKMAPHVGRYVGFFMARLQKEAGIEDIYCIGHSMGANIMAVATKTYQALMGTKVGKFTSIDLAKPFFDHLNTAVLPSREDADFVEIIHAYNGYYKSQHASYIVPLGQLDFYPNGGWKQPGCDDLCPFGRCFFLLNLVEKSGVRYASICHHVKGLMYFLESLDASNPEFAATKCHSWTAFKKGICDQNERAVMGYHGEPASEGKYYLRVKAEAPFALG